MRAQRGGTIRATLRQRFDERPARRFCRRESLTDHLMSSQLGGFYPSSPRKRDDDGSSARRMSSSNQPPTHPETVSELFHSKTCHDCRSWCHTSPPRRRRQREATVKKQEKEPPGGAGNTAEGEQERKGGGRRRRPEHQQQDSNGRSRSGPQPITTHNVENTMDDPRLLFVSGPTTHHGSFRRSLSSGFFLLPLTCRLHPDSAR